MKILINLFYLALLLISNNSYGQENEKSMRFSFNFGITYSNTIGKGVVEDSWLHGYPPNCFTVNSAGNEFILGKKIGVGLNKDLNKTFSFGFDLNYIEKGCIIPITYYEFLWYNSVKNRNEIMYENINTKSNIRLKYFVLPLHIETRFKMLYFQTSIYNGILLDADDYGKIEGVNYESDKDSRYSLIDIGIKIGLGTIIQISNRNSLKIGVNRSWSLTGNDRSGKPFEKYFYDEYHHKKYHWYNQCFSLDVKFERKI